MAKKDFPKVHYYDHDLIDMYQQTWSWIGDFWKSGNPENGLQNRFFSYPESDRINQVEDCLSTLFLVYSNRSYPVLSLMDNYYAKQEDDGAIRGEYRYENGSAIFQMENPEGVLPPLFSFDLFHGLLSCKG